MSVGLPVDFKLFKGEMIFPRSSLGTYCFFPKKMLLVKLYGDSKEHPTNQWLKLAIERNFANYGHTVEAMYEKLPDYKWDAFIYAADCLEHVVAQNNIKHSLKLTDDASVNEEKLDYIAKNFNSVLISFDDFDIVDKAIKYLDSIGFGYSLRSEVLYDDYSRLKEMALFVLENYRLINKWDIRPVMPWGRAANSLNPLFFEGPDFAMMYADLIASLGNPTKIYSSLFLSNGVENLKEKTKDCEGCFAYYFCCGEYHLDENNEEIPQYSKVECFEIREYWDILLKKLSDHMSFDGWHLKPVEFNNIPNVKVFEVARVDFGAKSKTLPILSPKNDLYFGIPKMGEQTFLYYSRSGVLRIKFNESVLVEKMGNEATAFNKLTGEKTILSPIEFATYTTLQDYVSRGEKMQVLSPIEARVNIQLGLLDAKDIENKADVAIALETLIKEKVLI